MLPLNFDVVILDAVGMPNGCKYIYAIVLLSIVCTVDVSHGNVQDTKSCSIEEHFIARSLERVFGERAQEKMFSMVRCTVIWNCKVCRYASPTLENLRLEPGRDLLSALNIMLWVRIVVRQISSFTLALGSESYSCQVG